MRARRPLWKGFAIQRGEFELGDLAGHLFSFFDLDLNDRGFTSKRIFVNHFIRFTRVHTLLVLFCGDHCLIGLDAFFAIHRKRKRPRVWRKVCWINRKGLLFVVQLQISLKFAVV